MRRNEGSGEARLALAPSPHRQTRHTQSQTAGFQSDRLGEEGVGLEGRAQSEAGRSENLMSAFVVEGDLLDQPVEVIVNAWNRNVIPGWLLLPQGVSGAIKKRARAGPFQELGKLGPIPLGGAVLRSAGRLRFKAIIHVAGINLLWRASERSIRVSVRNTIGLAHGQGLRSIAFPSLGAGSGGFNRERAKAIMRDELRKSDAPIDVILVSFKAR
jgi:O-acetyl-ADP-ribose deacetylase (regulator of RNase III)